MTTKTKNNAKGLDLQMFVDRLVEEKKFPVSLEKEVLEEIKKDLLTRVEERINAVIINNLTEEKLEEFNKKLGEEISDEEMQGFCLSNIPDLAQLIASELVVFRDTYLG